MKDKLERYWAIVYRKSCNKKRGLEGLEVIKIHNLTLSYSAGEIYILKLINPLTPLDEPDLQT
jgi:hypothetical protein